MMKNSLCLVGLLSLLTACHPARTVLLRNHTAQAVTMVFPRRPHAGFLPGTPATLWFAPTGERRDSALSYGPGAWTVADQDQLRQVLEQSLLVVGADTVSLASYFQLIGTYRVLVNEFYVEITGPAPAKTDATPAR